MKKLFLAFLYIFVITSVCSATTLTTNYSLNKPAAGDTDWATEINNNWDTVDGQMKTNSDAAADSLQSTDIDTFSELQSLVADETLLKAGTLTDTKYCTYDAASTDIICNSTPSGSGDLLADGTVPLTADWDAGNSSYDITAVEFKGALKGNADTVTTNANLTGEVTSVGNATTIADTVTVDAWVLGDSTATTINKITLTAPASASTLTIADGKTLTATNTVNLNTMTDGKWCKYTAAGTVLNCDQNEPAGGSSGFSCILSPQQGKLPTTNPMGIDAGEDEWKGNYDDTADECAVWACGALNPFGSGTWKATLAYTLETTSTSDTVELELSMLCLSATDDVDTATYGTVDALSSGSVSTEDGFLVTLTDASLAEDGCVEDDIVYVKVCRDASVSTDADDVEFRGGVVYEE